MMFVAWCDPGVAGLCLLSRGGVREKRAVGDGEGEGGRGAEKNLRSEDEDLVPDKKGRGEVGVSKMVTEVGVKIATPWGRMRGEMPTRE